MSSTYRDILGYSLAFVFFYYLVVFACIAPSTELVCAVAFEICVYVCFLAYRLKRRKARSLQARKVVLSTLLNCVPGAEQLSVLFSISIMGCFYLLTNKNGLLTKFALARLTSILANEKVSSEKKSQLQNDMDVLKEFIGTDKSTLSKIANDHEVTHLSLFITLAVQG